MDLSRTLYLGLTLTALAFPARRMALWFWEHGLDLDLLAATLSASAPARSVAGAVLVASTATVVFVIGEAWVRCDRLSLVCVPVTLIFGVAVGLPLYLYLRLRPLA